MVAHVSKLGIITKIFYIKSENNNAGSSVGYSHNNLFYLVTAKHIFSDCILNQTVNLEIYFNNKWINIKATILFDNSNSDIDIAVLKTNIDYPDFRNINTMDKFILGQDVYFFGFPCNQIIKHNSNPINKGFPIPFIKKGIFSAVESPILFLDGNNTFGFSGGPVIAWDYNDNNTNADYKIIAIISGYLNQEGKIMYNGEKINNLTHTYSIKYAIDIITSC